VTDNTKKLILLLAIVCTFNFFVGYYYGMGMSMLGFGSFVVGMIIGFIRLKRKGLLKPMKKRG